MKNTLVASAIPRKRFFVEMFTRDISLTDCILDLIDNSIDGLIRSRKINPGLNLLKGEDCNLGETTRKPTISIKVSEKEVSVRDYSGGIPLAMAVNEVFNFGHSDDEYQNNKQTSLGVYGVGLKRAIFKIGHYFYVESKTPTNSFVVEQDLREWVKKDDELSEWTFPIIEGDQTAVGKNAGTKIVITNLRDEVRHIIQDRSFVSRLGTEISRVYALFLANGVTIELNGEPVLAADLALGQSGDFNSAKKLIEINGVSVTMIASLAQRDKSNRWIGDKAGWYFSCNGRLILTADKTDISGWGTNMMPSFQPKYRGFVGYVFFVSNEPLNLPWTTTKRNLNKESLVYAKTRNEMRAIAKPVIDFLNAQYTENEIETEAVRGIASRVKNVGIGEAFKLKDQAFTVNIPKRVEAEETSIQYQVKKSTLQKVKRHLRNSRMSNSRVGKLTFDYYIKQEDIEA